ncbi:MAG TPA: ectoine/hydroxyectoine ABC transporter substrate-binding protein EhuB [Pseudonocardiaceae bacterium]|jgi:polar amino acid transport system substrate-binding protein|nr:ectoine/hydroxyectoine ABC transporter substrate-binding protein EhuB [Pseudonocardiaceae bacterium]
MPADDVTRRAFIKRTAMLGAAVIGGPALISACTSTSQSGGSSQLANLRKAGTIKIGIAGEQPYGYTDSSGRVTGEAPEVARAIFKKLGINNVTAQQNDFDTLIQGLNANQYDMVAAGMDITPTRCQSASFSVPDYTALVAFLVPKGNPKQVTDFASAKAKGVPMAVENGAVEKDYATQAGIPASQLQSFNTPDELLSAVTSGRAYAAVLTDISFKTLVKQNPQADVDVTQGFPVLVNGTKQGETGGFVFRKNETELLNAFNKQLTTMHSNGEWLKIVQPFGFSQGNIPPAGVTTQKLCSASS